LLSAYDLSQYSAALLAEGFSQHNIAQADLDEVFKELKPPPDDEKEEEVKSASALTSRLNDLDIASMGLLPPISGLFEQPLVSLSAACDPIVAFLPKVKAFVFMAGRAGKKLAAQFSQHGVTADEAGSIWLYTCESDLFKEMNRRLRSSDRLLVKPFFLYLRLLFSGVGKLPAVNNIVWRGLELNPLKLVMTPDAVVASLVSAKDEQEELFWWSATSTSVDLKTALLFSGGKKCPHPRVVFKIRCLRGARIEGFSAIKSEAEILLLPGTCLQVKAVNEIVGQVWIVEADEVIPPVQLVG
jgi:hypothetical protein